MCEDSKTDCDESCSCMKTRVCSKVVDRKEWDVYVGCDSIMPSGKAYVFFVDIMGMKTTMFRSYNRGTVFLCKLHCILLKTQAEHMGVLLYPVMDGAYVVSKDWKEMIEFVRDLYTRLARIFVLTENIDECFLVRGALAYGPVLSGAEITENVNRELSSNGDYKRQLLVGYPMISANEGENKAPPLGVYIDESIREELCPEIAGVWYKWCRCDSLWQAIARKCKEYFAWARNCSMELIYPENKIDEHEKTARQFWMFD